MGQEVGWGGGGGSGVEVDLGVSGPPHQDPPPAPESWEEKRGGVPILCGEV